MFAVTRVSGIGLVVARQLLALGASVALADVSPDALGSATAQVSDAQDRIMTTVVDVSNREQVDSWIESNVQRFGKLDGVNMAGVIGKHYRIRNLEDQDNDEWDLIMRVSVTGLMYCLRAGFNAMTNSVDGAVWSCGFDSGNKRFPQACCILDVKTCSDRFDAECRQGSCEGRDTSQCRCTRSNSDATAGQGDWHHWEA